VSWPLLLSQARVAIQRRHLIGALIMPVRVRLIPIARPTIDLDRLARAALLLAREQAAKAARADAPPAPASAAEVRRDG